MRHRKANNNLKRKSSHRKAMLSNMSCSLILHKRIKTTLAKAKALQDKAKPKALQDKKNKALQRALEKKKRDAAAAKRAEALQNAMKNKRKKKVKAPVSSR